MQALIVILVVIIIALIVLCLKLNNESKPAPKEQIVIEVYKKDNRYNARVVGSKNSVDGESFYEALGGLVNHHSETGIDVKYLDEISR